MLGVRPTRWIYGLPGVWLAQTLALTPVAYLVLVGVVDGISPSFEEAAQTLRASRWQTFTTITLPLMAPGLLNAFLIVFIESLADFGNPLLLGGNLEVLSVAIYFAIVGVQQDPGRAAILAIVLLSLSLALFLIQRRLLARRSFVTISGKGEGGRRLPLPRSMTALAAGLALAVGRAGDRRLRDDLLRRVLRKVGTRPRADAAPLRRRRSASTSRQRQRAADRRRLELVPDDADDRRGLGAADGRIRTARRVPAQPPPLRRQGRVRVRHDAVVRDAGDRRRHRYILAFNAPPIELAYTGIILVACFVFRDMTTSLRAGLASLARSIRSLDEASATMRAGTLRNAAARRAAADAPGDHRGARSTASSAR